MLNFIFILRLEKKTILFFIFLEAIQKAKTDREEVGKNKHKNNFFFDNKKNKMGKEKWKLIKAKVHGDVKASDDKRMSEKLSE